MDKLFKGVLKFQQEDYEAQRELFSRLERQQNPHTLFIGCADSRIIPTLLTQTEPGELFQVRNVANIVPPWSEDRATESTCATIEYAVVQLKVETVVICGHSNCGGCAALHLSEADLAALPYTRHWLQHSASVPERVARLRHSDDLAEREWLTEKVNVLVQMRHLLTHPHVAERVRAGQLTIQGWHYDISSGVVRVFDDATGHFEKVQA